jgi:cell division protein FtsQ
VTATAVSSRRTGASRRTGGGRRRGPASTRRRKKSRRSWRRKALAITAILLVLVLLGGSIWVVYFSTALVTKRVNVIGTRHLTPAQVSYAVQVPLGVPLARQNLDEIAHRATTLRAVESANATRNWPSTITVSIVERRPVFAIHQLDGYLVVDKFGVAYQTQPTLPSQVVLAEVSPTDALLLRDVATVAAALPGKLRGKVDRITASNGDHIVLTLQDSGPKVTWGSSADSELKAEVVTALLKRKPRSSIDVSSPHNPAVR